MTYETLLAEFDAGITTVTLNRPEKMNAMSPTLLAELKDVLSSAAEDDQVAVVVLRSTGKVFCAGYDLSPDDWIISQFPAEFEGGVDLQKDREDIVQLLKYWLGMRKFPKPIVAAVQGPALSGAGELLAMCDIVIASEEARFGHPAGRDLGIPPTVFLWPLLIGMRKTKELLYTAKLIDAAEAGKLGLVNEVVAGEELEARVRSMAEDIARTPVNHLKILKEAADNWYDNMGLETSSRQAADLDAVFHQSPTFNAFFKLVGEKGMKAALDERRRLFG
ncbi:EchA2 [Pseudooceanicola batsensis HTCC2597]|uniref:EchA2 n=2 Tax=Pseudooceanicola batsensis TaxID=314255 RepID=A3U1D3_PSEBH|nr:EchA2 [Pseudooceanicola batsensis HTCC2597]